ncbi:hypothetical protein D3C78_1087890 [compost metagenome]
MHGLADVAEHVGAVAELVVQRPHGLTGLRVQRAAVAFQALDQAGGFVLIEVAAREHHADGLDALLHAGLRQNHGLAAHGL